MSGVFRSNLWEMILWPSIAINGSVFRSGLRTHQSLDLLISKRCFFWHATVCFRRLAAAKFDRYAWISIEYRIESPYWQAGISVSRDLFLSISNKSKRKTISPSLYQVNKSTNLKEFDCFHADLRHRRRCDRRLEPLNWHDLKGCSSLSFVLVWAVLGENGCHQHGVNVCHRLGANELTATMKNYTIRFFENSIIKVVWTNSNILDILLTMKVSDRVRVEQTRPRLFIFLANPFGFEQYLAQRATSNSDDEAAAVSQNMSWKATIPKIINGNTTHSSASFLLFLSSEISIDFNGEKTKPITQSHSMYCTLRRCFSSTILCCWPELVPGRCEWSEED